MREPEYATTGRNPEIGVGNFVCVCGHTIIDAEEPGDQSITLLATKGEKPFSDDNCIQCSECHRTWWLEDMGRRWRVDDAT